MSGSGKRISGVFQADGEESTEGEREEVEELRDSLLVRAGDTGGVRVVGLDRAAEGAG